MLDVPEYFQITQVQAEHRLVHYLVVGPCGAAVAIHLVHGFKIVRPWPVNCAISCRADFTSLYRELIAPAVTKGRGIVRRQFRDRRRLAHGWTVFPANKGMIRSGAVNTVNTCHSDTPKFIS